MSIKSVMLKFNSRKAENSLGDSLKCFQEENIEAAEGMLNSLIINYPPVSYAQFKRDCEYYYSKVLNYPVVSPTVLQLDFMRRCQLECRVCKIWSRQGTRLEDELSYDELKILLDQAIELGVSHCRFSGGEPFMLQYLFDILKYAKNKGIFNEINTNGLLLTEENCKKLIELALDQINVSVDGASAQTHDYHRNKAGSFDEIMRNIKCLVSLKRERGSSCPLIFMVCVLTDKNFHEMLDYVKLAENIGVGVFFQPYVAGNDSYFKRLRKDEFTVPAARLPFLYEEIDRVIEYKRSSVSSYLISNTVDSFKNIKEYFSGSLSHVKYCFAGFNRITIMPKRKTVACPIEIGDFSKNTLREIWFSKKAKKARIMAYNCSKPCLLGAAYFPGPSANDIFLITKRYLIYLKKNKLYNKESLSEIREYLSTYRFRLQKEKMPREIEKIDFISRYLDNLSCRKF